MRTPLLILLLCVDIFAFDWNTLYKHLYIAGDVGYETHRLSHKKTSGLFDSDTFNTATVRAGIKAMTADYRAAVNLLSYTYGISGSDRFAYSALALPFFDFEYGRSLTEKLYWNAGLSRPIVTYTDRDTDEAWISFSGNAKVKVSLLYLLGGYELEAGYRESEHLFINGSHATIGSFFFGVVSGF